jgi:putative hydrolase of the HAD superfamily
MNAAPDSGSQQFLLVDADDTLWANNVYFERAIANFISFLNHREFTPEQVRQVLNEVERECIVKHGYGLHSFAHALGDTFERLAGDAITPETEEVLRRLAHEISAQPIEVFEGVPETLDYLAGRHHLIMLTKGNPVEQSGKLERSGLRDYFSAIEIVAEKDIPAYEAMVEKYALARDRTWMIGNSPVSDINPALATGLNAVFVPNDMTWVLENDQIQSDGTHGRLLVVERFADLRQHF